MYNSLQLWYIIISLTVTTAILIASGFIKKQKHKDLFLKFWAIGTFVVHISVMWVDYLTQGFAFAPDSVLFPIYFCNLAMYLLIAVSLMKNKKSKAFEIIATFVAYAGTLGALITVFESHYFAGSNPDLSYGSVKSMVSHSFMLVGALYLFVGGYVKIRVKNLVYFAYGLLAVFVLGNFTNWLFAVNSLPAPNSMYLQKSAIEGVPIFTGYFIAMIMVLLIFAFTAIWEQFALKKGERWFNKLAVGFKKSKK